MFPGGIVAGSALHLGEIRVPLPEAIRGEVREGQEVILGVRQEAARLILNGREPSEGVRLQGVVEVVEPDFAHRTARVYVNTPLGSCAATAPLKPSLRHGDEVKILLPIEGLYFFDGEYERRLG